VSDALHAVSTKFPTLVSSNYREGAKFRTNIDFMKMIEWGATRCRTLRVTGRLLICQKLTR
jgi:hypothetical protein